MGGQNFPPSAPSLWGQPQTLGVLSVVAVRGPLLFHRAPESARRLSSPKCLLKAALGSPTCVIRCCEPHSLLVKCFWRSILFFKYKSTEYRFPVDEDGSFLVDLKVKQKSPVQADVWTPESIHDVHLCARWNTVTCKSPGGARSEGALSPSTAAVQPAGEEPCPAEDWSWCEEGQKVAADVVYY